MKAVTKVLPSNPQFMETILAKDQPQYIPLPVTRLDYADGTVSLISRYHLSWRERLRILWTGSLWLEQLTFGRPLQPQRPTVFEPLTDADNDECKIRKMAGLKWGFMSNLLTALQSKSKAER